MRPRSAISCRCRSRLVGAVSAVALGTALKRGGTMTVRIRMTLADLTVDIIPIVGSIAGKRRNRADNLLQQGTNLRAVIDILAGQLGGDDLSSVGVHAEMELSPGPTCPCGMLLDEPLTGTAELEPSAVHQQVDRFAAWSWSRHRQCFAPSADRRMVGCCEIKTKQSKKGCDQPFGLA